MLGLLVIAILGTWAIVQKQTIAEVAADLPRRPAARGARGPGGDA